MATRNSRSETNSRAARSTTKPPSQLPRQCSSQQHQTESTEIEFLKTVFAELTGSGSQHHRRVPQGPVPQFEPMDNDDCCGAKLS